MTTATVTTTNATAMTRSNSINNTDDSSFLWDDLKHWLTPKHSLPEAIQLFQNELQERLNTSTVSMIPTKSLSKGIRSSILDNVVAVNHKRILAIDFGGTRLKFAFVSMPDCKIQSQHDLEITNKIVNQDFFNDIIGWIVNHPSFLSNLDSIEDIDNDLLVAVTFSFPLNERKEIVAMGKGFVMTDDLVGVPLDSILKKSFIENGMPNVKIGDIINDSVAVYLTSEVFCPQQIIGTKGENEDVNSFSLILGTGTNSCFELPFDSLPVFKQWQFKDSLKKNENVKSSIINSEIGFLGTFIDLAPFDISTNRYSKINMPLETITSGKYIPIILQNILQDYHIISNLQSSAIKFDGQLVCELVKQKNLTKLSLKYEEKFGLSLEQLIIVQKIAILLIQRAAFYLVGALKAIINLKYTKIVEENENQVFQFGYVGSFLQYCTFFQDQISIYSNNTIQLQFLEDSNLIGAAIAAFMN
ncbi:hexokinase NDAI_0J02790 [Naumovozyma dairenensis CBS 421]|uniref:Phosphotransferase n=1 Tax=Naumovozyma dairenensis (strain ATCC 10597 / BCRC 20456 / CBS 421 / NBRC 0211 / NRRL Y-12639) TaxID=1071378 RepID=G0WH93_NAUDC|nr:hypothetical protein NDAI_0J02790 [Naumovozyma dairenensis CBS 421]CCD27171.1 hypothetical protein NDAI_0J02790 [Naumovozyma dairenensis CBS 421]